MTIKAVLWDFGGVITTSPFEAFNRFEESQQLPIDFIRKINSTNPTTNAWALLESNQINADRFDQLFADESRALGHEIRGGEVLALLSGSIRPEMVNALKIIKSRMKIGCITNNVKTGLGPSMTNDTTKAKQVEEVMSIFDVLIESSKVNMRKPDPEIYKLACREMDILPENALFLDDLGINLKPARALGMATIKVINSRQAIKELEQALGMSLQVETVDKT